jgi:hypothetical protein
MDTFSALDVVLAYFDPGSGSLLMQTLVGGAAGLLVFAKYLWDAAPSLLARCRRRDSSRNVRN